MNLADAIRQASKRFQTAAMSASASPLSSSPQQQEVPAMDEPTTSPSLAGPQEAYPQPPDPVIASSGGAVVRLEIFLSPEQMYQMLKGIIHGAHTVMTVREAAQHLRVKQKTILEMAEKGEIPAFCVDGEWKFPRHALDEWIATRTLMTETSPNQGKEKNHREKNHAV